MWKSSLTTSKQSTTEEKERKKDVYTLTYIKPPTPHPPQPTHVAQTAEAATERAFIFALLLPVSVQRPLHPFRRLLPALSFRIDLITATFFLAAILWSTMRSG